MAKKCTKATQTKLAKIVVNYMKQNNKTQRDLASVLNTSQSTVSRIVQAKIDVPANLRSAIESLNATKGSLISTQKQKVENKRKASVNKNVTKLVKSANTFDVTKTLEFTNFVSACAILNNTYSQFKATHSAEEYSNFVKATAVHLTTVKGV